MVLRESIVGDSVMDGERMVSIGGSEETDTVAAQADVDSGVRIRKLIATDMFVAGISREVYLEIKRQIETNLNSGHPEINLQGRLMAEYLHEELEALTKDLTRAMTSEGLVQLDLILNKIKNSVKIEEAA